MGRTARAPAAALIPILCAAIPGDAQTARWAAVEELRLGTAAGAEALAFSPRPVVTVGGDGAIYVADLGSKDVRVFNDRGRLLRRFGRHGAGPGEFLTIGEAGWIGDTLWITDPLQLRTTLFTRDGRPVRTIGVVNRASREYAPAGARALLSDGSILTQPSGLERRRDSGPVLLRLPLLRHDPRTERVDTLGWRDLRTRMLRVPDSGRLLSIIQPWDDSPLFAVAPDGGAIVRVDRTAAPGARPTFRVTRTAPSGRPFYSRAFRYPPDPITVDARRWAQTRAREIHEVRPIGNLRSFVDALARELYVPPHMPPVTAVVAGTDGTVWLRREARDGPTAEWLVLDEAGRIEAGVRLPSDLTVHQAQRGRVWGVVHDELGVPYVVRYRVGPSRR